MVVADSRAKRDGKFIEKLGTYNPNTNPATININFENTLKWVQTGAEMSETARAILSYKGILHKNHLLNGIKKGALTAEQVEEKFAAWEAEKVNKIDGKKDGLEKSAAAEKAARLTAEAESNAAKAKAVEAKNTPPAAEVAEEEAPETPEETPETPEETPDIQAEAPAAEAATETPAEEAPAAPEAAAEGETEA